MLQVLLNHSYVPPTILDRLFTLWRPHLSTERMYNFLWHSNADYTLRKNYSNVIPRPLLVCFRLIIQNAGFRNDPELRPLLLEEAFDRGGDGLDLLLFDAQPLGLRRGFLLVTHLCCCRSFAK